MVQHALPSLARAGKRPALWFVRCGLRSFQLDCHDRRGVEEGSLTDVWSKDPRRKRGWLASTRGNVIVAAFVLVAAGAAGYLSWSPPSRVDCETMVGQSQAVLDQADKDLKAASATGTAARCSAYKKRVSALTE